MLVFMVGYRCLFPRTHSSERLFWDEHYPLTVPYAGQNKRKNWFHSIQRSRDLKNITEKTLLRKIPLKDGTVT
jgi:hypothetical protein